MRRAWACGQPAPLFQSCAPLSLRLSLSVQPLFSRSLAVSARHLACPPRAAVFLLRRQPRLTLQHWSAFASSAADTNEAQEPAQNHIDVVLDSTSQQDTSAALAEYVRSLPSTVEPKREPKKRPTPVTWDERFEQLLAYRREIENFDPPVRSVPYPGLATWLVHQQSLQLLGKLDKDKEARLTAIGMPWLSTASRRRVRNWWEYYEELRLFYKRFGHCHVPHMWEENIPLSKWAREQRGLFTRRKLSAEQIKALDRLRYEWKTRVALWQKHFEELTVFKSRYGNLDVYRWKPSWAELYLSNLTRSWKGRNDLFQFKCRVYAQMKEENMPKEEEEEEEVDREEEEEHKAAGKAKGDDYLGSVDAGSETEDDANSLYGHGDEGEDEEEEEEDDYDDEDADEGGGGEDDDDDNGYGNDIVDYRPPSWQDLADEAVHKEREFGFTSVTVAPADEQKQLQQEEGQEEEELALTGEALSELTTRWPYMSSKEKKSAIKREFLKQELERERQNVRSLGFWVSKQRALYFDGKLGRVREDSLRELGFDFGSGPHLYDGEVGRWWRNLREASAIYAAGKAVSTVRQPALARWLSNARYVYRLGKLPPRKAAGMEQAGLVGQRLVLWEKRLADFAAFWKEHGRAPSRAENRSLARWVEMTRYHGKLGKLSPKKIQELDQVNFPWVVKVQSTTTTSSDEKDTPQEETTPAPAQKKVTKKKKKKTADQKMIA